MNSSVARVHHSVIATEPHIARYGYLVHQLVWQAFPGYPDNAPQPFTFRRLDRTSTLDTADKKVLFLVQSRESPQWRLSPRVELLQGPSAIEYTLKAGDRFIYRVVAAPIKTLASNRTRKNNRKVRLLSAESIWAWFERRALLAGFRVDEQTSSFTKTAVKDIKFNADGAEKSIIPSTRAQFDGVMEVVDTEVLKKALEQGFSQRKSFGYGMLNILSTE